MFDKGRRYSETESPGGLGLIVGNKGPPDHGKTLRSAARPISRAPVPLFLVSLPMPPGSAFFQPP